MIAVRCDASEQLGLGHVARCLELARKLRPHDDVVFASTPDPANDLIQEHAYQTFHKGNGEDEEPFLIRLASTLRPRVLLVDTRYPYSAAVIRQLRHMGEGPRTMTVMIGNVCNGLPECDLAVFPSAHEDERLLKQYLTDDRFHATLVGIRYVIIRRDIKEARARARGTPRARPRLVITTGGSDPGGVMIRLIPLMSGFDLDAEVSFLPGSSFAHTRELERMRPGLPDHFCLRPYSIEEVASADAAVCTFGVSVYEMMYLGIPTVCVSHTEENARYAGLLYHRHPVFADLGFIDDVHGEALRVALQEALSRRSLGTPLPGEGMSIVDGHGADRIAQAIMDRMTVSP